MIRDALRSLARDGWVIGIACAAALAYAVVTFIQSAVAVVLSIVDGIEVPEDGAVTDAFYALQPYSATINGHAVSFEGLLNRTILLVVVLLLAAVALYATRPEDGESSSQAS